METAANPQTAGVPAQPETAGSLTLPVDTAPLDPLDGIPHALVARAEAKAEIVAAFRAFKDRSCRALGATLKTFVESYNSGKEPVSTAAREIYSTIEAPTLQRAWRRFEKLSIAGLIPGYGKRRGDSIIARNPSMREFVIASMAHNPRVRVRFVLDGIKARFLEGEIPSEDTVWRFMCDWKRDNSSLFQRIADPDGARNKNMLALGAMDAGISRVGQLWEIDGSPADCYVLGTVETPGGRLHLLATIDIASRKIVAHLAPLESSDALAALLAKAIPILGVPDAVRHDNGAGFVSARTQRALARLGIASIKTPAYRGDRKPFIERGLGTILHSFIENIPGFIGHSVVEASQLRKRHSFAQRRGERRNMRKLYRIELTAPELQALLDQWLEHVYGNRKHSALGRTPAEVFGEADRSGQIRRLADDRVLDLLLGEDGTGVITKKGLRCAGRFFWADELVEHMRRTVQFVRTRDEGRLIVYTADAAPRFICIAVDQESAGLDRGVLALAAKQRQNTIAREGTEELRALKRKHRPQTVYREIIDNAVAHAKARLPQTGAAVAALPYRSAAVTAAAEALEALDEPAEPAPHDEETLRAGAIALADIEHQRELRDLQLDDDELDALWIAIRRERRALTLREKAFLAHYQHSAESWADCFETTTEHRALILRLAAMENEKCA